MLTQTILDELLVYLPSGVNSPVRSFQSVGITPLIASHGEGAYLFDTEGRRYIDYCGSWGALMHGHAHPEIIEAAAFMMRRGSSFGLSTEIEGKLAKKVHDLVPSMERLRFVCSGTEAGMTAIRLARGYTNRSTFIKFIGHYHGHSDAFLVQAGSGMTNLTPTSTSHGVPKEVVQHTLCLPFNDEAALLKAFEERKGEIAAVILEPVAGNMGVVPAEKKFVDLLREVTKKEGALLIFDEVITGFRVAKGGAQSLFGITPDLTMLGKVVAGGFPAACVGGRKEIMDLLAPKGPVYQAGTLAGNPVAMAAGLKALELLDRPGLYEELERKTKRLQDSFEGLLKNACVNRVGSMISLFFGPEKVTARTPLDELRFANFFRAMLASGIYLPPSAYEAWFVSSVHTDEMIDHTSEAITRYVKSL